MAQMPSSYFMRLKSSKLKSLIILYEYSNWVVSFKKQYSSVTMEISSVTLSRKMACVRKLPVISQKVY